MTPSADDQVACQGHFMLLYYHTRTDQFFTVRSAYVKINHSNFYITVSINRLTKVDKERRLGRKTMSNTDAEDNEDPANRT